MENHQITFPNKTVTLNGIIYQLNEKEKEAAIIGNNLIQCDLIIPYSIHYEKQEYVITSISKGAFRQTRLKSIQFSADSKLEKIEKEAFENSLIQRISIPHHLKFIGEKAFFYCINLKQIEIPDNSELRTIEKHAFYKSLIESITIPSNLIELNNGWCSGTDHLNSIKVMPNNPYFKSYEDKYILGKSSKEQQNFDVLVFCVRNMSENAIIPDFIEIIGHSSFYGCKKIQHVVFSNNSMLRIIEESSFYLSSIQSIIIPPHLTKICQNAFFWCEKLEKIEIPENSELKTIGSEAFYRAPIKSLVFPSSLIELNTGWCKGTYSLNSIQVMPNNPCFKSYEDKFILGKSSNEQENFDFLVFCVRNIEVAFIPDFIEIIGHLSFDSCEYLQDIIFSNDSKLRIIEKEAFSQCMFQVFNVPIHLQKICEKAFYGCEDLQIFEIPENSELKTIEKDAFSCTDIDTISIPSSLIDLNKGWYCGMRNLSVITVNQSNPRYAEYEGKFIIGKTSIEQENYDVLVFANRNFKSLIIPNFIKIIDESSFNNYNLHRIEIPSDSILQKIEKYAFKNSSIEFIKFPDCLSQIEESAFSYCEKLRKVEIPPNSKLQVLNKCVFSNTDIRSVFISQHIKQISDDAFLGCNELQIIEIDENSELQSIKKEFLKRHKNMIIIMVPFNLRHRVDLNE